MVAVGEHHALGHAGGAARVAEHAGVFQCGRADGKHGAAAADQRFIGMRAREFRRVEAHVLHHRRHLVTRLGDALLPHPFEQEGLGLAMIGLIGDLARREAVVHGNRDGAQLLYGVIGLEEGRTVVEHQDHPIAGAHSQSRQPMREPAGAIVEFAPAHALIAVDQKHPLGVVPDAAPQRLFHEIGRHMLLLASRLTHRSPFLGSQGV